MTTLAEGFFPGSPRPVGSDAVRKRGAQPIAQLSECEHSVWVISTLLNEVGKRVPGAGLQESALRIRWPKYWHFSFSISPSNEQPGLISFRMDWLDLLAVQGTLKSLLQHHSSKGLPRGKCPNFERLREISHLSLIL